MSCDLPTNWRDCAPPEAVALAREIEAELIERFGFVLSGGALERVLGFTSTAALRKALQIDPRRRYEDVAEFVYDLHHPNGAFVERTLTPLIERSPLLFWKAASFALGLALLADLALRR